MYNRYINCLLTIAWQNSFIVCIQTICNWNTKLCNHKICTGTQQTQYLHSMSKHWLYSEAWCYYWWWQWALMNDVLFLRCWESENPSWISDFSHGYISHSILIKNIIVDYNLVWLECSSPPQPTPPMQTDYFVHKTSEYLLCYTHLQLTIHTVTRPPPTKPPLPTVRPTNDCRLVRCARPNCPNPLPPLPEQCCPRCLGKQ